MQLDKLNGIFFGVIILGVMATTFLILFWKIEECEFAKKLSIISFTIVVICAVLEAITPSTKTAIAMLTVPAITKGEIPANFVELLDVKLKSMIEEAKK
jgi:hypothetical protein